MLKLHIKSKKFSLPTDFNKYYLSHKWVEYSIISIMIVFNQKRF